MEQAIESDLDVILLSHINKPNGISTKLKDLLVLARKIRIALIATAVILIGVMAAVNRKHIGGLLYWVGTSLFCSSMLILVPCAILRVQNIMTDLRYIMTLCIMHSQDPCMA